MYHLSTRRSSWLTPGGTLEAMIQVTLAATALHMGSLHAYEQALVLLLAFGPLVALVVVVHVVRRRDIAEEEAGTRDGAPGRDGSPTD